MSGRLRVRHVLEDEHEQLKLVRLESLAADGHAFGATYERDASQPEACWRKWARWSESGSDQRTFVLVDRDEEWVGLVLVRRDPTSPQIGILNAMWIAPSARGHGGVTLLCDASARWALERGVQRLDLIVQKNNTRAIEAYAGAGFTVAPPSDGECRSGNSMVVMSRRLIP